jgi:hypothetical protein
MGRAVTPDSMLPALQWRARVARHVSMSWARGLKRVLGIDIDHCAGCGGKLKIIASIEQPEVIARIPAHLEHQSQDRAPSEGLPSARGPPQQVRLF